MSTRSGNGDSFKGSGPVSWPPDPAPAVRKTRAGNSNRRPPLPRAADAADGTAFDDILDDDVGVDGQQEEGAAAEAAGPSDTSRTWTERMKRRDIQWRAAIPELRASGIKDYPLACKLKHAVGAVQLQGIRDSIGQWGKLHACCQRDDGTFDQSCLTLLEERPTTYIGHTCHGTINVPHWLCSKCNQKVKPNPVALACFPSTPTAAAYWWDVDLHNQYSRLALHGTSATGTAHRTFFITVPSYRFY